MKSEKAASIPLESLMDDEELREGWDIFFLKDLTINDSAITYGVLKPGEKTPDGIPMLRVVDIVNSKVNKKNLYFITPELANSYSRTKLSGGEILISVQGTVGKIAIVPHELTGANISRTLAVIPLKNKEYAKWLFYCLQSPKIQSLIQDSTGGTTRDSLNIRDLRLIPILIPPLAEQKHIVARVEALLTHVNAARDRLSRMPLIMKKFRQAVLAAACSGRLTEGWREENPDVEPAEDALLHCIQIATTQKSSRKIRKRGTVGMPEIDLPEDLPNIWTIKKIKELVEIGAVTDYQDGNHGELYPRTTDFGDNGIKFLTATQVFDNEVRLSEAPLLKKEKASQLRIGFAKPRDVLLTHNATVGRVALMPDNCGEIILGTSVTYYRLNPEFIDPKYCCYAMQGQFWQSQLWAIMEQTTRNQVSITKQAEFYFPLPPLAEQHEIVRRVGMLFERADAIDREVAAAGRRCERLTQAVLGKAFAGKL
jgi:type I restriction enzyme S subunit